MPSRTLSLLLEIAERCVLFATEGTRGPYAATLGRKEYEAMLRAKDYKQRWQELQRLKRRRMIEIRERGDHVSFILTDAGRAAAIKERIKNTKIPLKNGYCCLVVFDFPENVRTARAIFRRFLWKSHFKRIQKSVWASPYDAFEPLGELIVLLRCDEWVHIYRARHWDKRDKNVLRAGSR